MARPESFGFAALALGQSISQFNTYMPPLSDVRKGSTDNKDLRGDVRIGETAALVGSLLVGILIAAITGDPTGAYVSVAVCAVYVAMYEMVLRASFPGE